jgi:hypothetical protein
MAEFTFVVVFAIFAFVLVTILALVMNPRLRARIKLPGHANFEIDTSREEDSGLLQPAQPASVMVKSGHVPQAWLVIKRRGKRDWTYPLDGQMPIYLGRGDDNHIRLAKDSTADKRHAVIYVENNRYYINNLSPRGTWVNKRLITKQVLGDGNTIQIGATLIIFRERRK